MYKTFANLDPEFSSTTFCLAIVTRVEVVETVTSFLTFKIPNTYLCSVSSYCSWNTWPYFCPFFPLFVSKHVRVDSVSWGGRIPGILGISFVLIFLLLLVFPGLIRKLKILDGNRYGGLKSLEVISAIYHSLGLDLVYNDMGRLIPLETI